MTEWRKGRRKLTAILLVGILMIAALSIRLWIEFREDAKSYSFWVRSGQAEITEELIGQIGNFPGVRCVSSAWEIPIHLSIGAYETNTVLLAVDQSCVPMRIENCETDLEVGSRIPVYVGSKGLDGLLDDNQHVITDQQKTLLFEQGLGTEMQFTVSGGQIPQEEAGIVYKAAEGIWAAEIADEEGRIYVGWEEGKRLAERLGIPRSIHEIYLEVEGKENCQKMCLALERAGIETTAQ